MAKFRIERANGPVVNSTYSEELHDAAQEAECLHARLHVSHHVVAMLDLPPTIRKGEIVYTSKGAPE